MSGIERRPVFVRGLWVVVTIDADAADCTVWDNDGGRYWVSGVSGRSVQAVAEYGRQYGITYASLSQARAAIDGGQS
jgi:uncharacterized protein YjdB